MQTDVIVIGGGLAGLFNALLLNRAGISVMLIEKETYPFQKVCGEYISNEVLPFFKSQQIDLDALNVARINQLEVTATSGKKLKQPLQSGGFGLSRLTFDHYLYTLAKAEGVNFLLATKVTDVVFHNEQFEVKTTLKSYFSKLVIGAYGKRANLDRQLNRSFFFKRNPYIGVKYHIKLDFSHQLIQLNNFENGYCGINKVDGDKFCLCYLAHRDDLRKHENIKQLEENVLYKNPYLKAIFNAADFLQEKPTVINEISFEKKTPVENHILMCGDTAGMITPLCGNGMSMAIHAAVILSSIIIENYKTRQFDAVLRAKIEKEYTTLWNNQFALRLWTGRQIQKLFGRNKITSGAIGMLNTFPPLATFIINKTHGKPFG